MELRIERDHRLDVEPVAEHAALPARITSALQIPGDHLLAGRERLLAVEAHAGPVRHPIRRIAQELGHAERVRQHDEELAVVHLLPFGQHRILRRLELGIVAGETGDHHRQLVRIGADRLHAVLEGEVRVRSADEGRPQLAGERGRHPFLPQEAVAPPRAELGQAGLRVVAQALDLVPQLGLGLGVEHVQLELVERSHGRARAQLADDRERVDLPQGDVGPAPLEREHVLAVPDLQPVVRKPEAAQILDILRAKDVPPSVEAVAGEPDQLVLLEMQVPRVIELRAQRRFGNELGESHLPRPIDQAEGDRNVRIEHPDELMHQELVKIRVEQRPGDRVEPVIVVVDPRGEIEHRLVPANPRTAPITYS